jgi:hypothetical protein
MIIHYEVTIIVVHKFEFTIIRSNILCDDTRLWLVMFMLGQGVYVYYKILAKSLNYKIIKYI